MNSTLLLSELLVLLPPLGRLVACLLLACLRFFGSGLTTESNICLQRKGVAKSLVPLE